MTASHFSTCGELSKARRLLSILLVCFGSLTAASSEAKERGVFGAIPNVIEGIEWNRLTVSTFTAEIPELRDTALEVTRTIRDVLARSGPYALKQSDILDAESVSVDAKPDFRFWQTRGVVFLIVGQVSRERDGRLKVVFRLWDVYRASQMIGLSYRASDDKREDLALAVAGDVFERLTSEHDLALSTLGIH